MIYFLLFKEFLKTGLFSFGGAYGAIPVIQEMVLKNGWMDEAAFADMIAVSESTSGSIMVNAATYIGNSQAGFFGALIATTGVVLPSFVIVLLLVALFQKLIKHRRVQMALKSIKLCLMGVITGTGLYMSGAVVFISDRGEMADYRTLLVLIILTVFSAAFFLKKKQTVSPILLIAVSAVMGCVLF